ncbi:WG repeat-containing protein [Brevibacillus fluminis]|uniref:WG repeat-containing protein n=1 Tax=Brevibacillus fluminis TaxID=511487 RepID=UPI003F8C2D0F
MFKRTISMGIAILIGASALIAPAQAAAVPYLKPYVTDTKYGFTDGSKRITQPVYDDFKKAAHVLIVTKNGKQGVIDAKTGATLIAPIWDQIDIPELKNVAVLRKGAALQTFTFSTKTLSKAVFKEYATFYLSDKHTSVIALSGNSSMLMDTDGKVLIPPFQGNIRFVDWKEPKSADANRDTTRYAIAVSAKELTMFDPVSLKPMFSVPAVTLAGPDNEIPTVSYLQVVRNGKTGLVKRDGSFALEPNYSGVQLLEGTFASFRGPGGVGLVSDGKIVLEPGYEEVGGLPYPATGFFGRKGDIVTYYVNDGSSSFSLRKGAAYLYGKSDTYVLGKDVDSGLYGVKNLKGETIVPFEYPGLEGVPAAWVLVRKDGKKGILAQRNLSVVAPEVWFDSFVTMGGYDMLALTDGKKLALYSQERGLLVPFQEGLQIRFDSKHNAVLVTTPDNKTREYGAYEPPAEPNQKPEEKPDINAPQIEQLNEQLSTSYVRDKGYTILRTASGEPVSSQIYQFVRKEDQLILANIDAASTSFDVYTATGELINKGLRIAGRNDPEVEPIVLLKAGDSYYALAAKENTRGKALVRLHGNQMTVLTDFTYWRMSRWGDLGAEGVLVNLSRQNGGDDFTMLTTDSIRPKLEQVEAYGISDQVYFMQKQGTWNVFDKKLNPLTTGNYKSLRNASVSPEKSQHLIVQDAKTGLYGLINTKGAVLAAPKYEYLSLIDDTFAEQLDYDPGIQHWFVVIKGNQFGYLNENGKEMFMTPLYTKAPKVTNLAVKAGAFPEFENVMAVASEQLVDYGKPYSQIKGDAENMFYGHVALYFDLPQDSSKEAIIAALVSKGILPATRTGADFSDDDFFALAYYMVNGASAQQLTGDQRFQWANDRGLYFQRGGHDCTSPFVDYDFLFMNKLLLAKKANVKLKPKTLSFETLTDKQRSMLLSLIQVNGIPYDKARLPLTRAILDPQLKKLIAEYNKASVQLLQAYLKNRL